MRTYLDLLQHILDNGGDKGDPYWHSTRSVFGHQMRLIFQRLSLLTTKKTFRSIVIELLWFLKGDTNVQYPQRTIKSAFWDEWATAEQTARLVALRVNLVLFMDVNGATLAANPPK